MQDVRAYLRKHRDAVDCAYQQTSLRSWKGTAFRPTGRKLGTSGSGIGTCDRDEGPVRARQQRLPIR